MAAEIAEEKGDHELFEVHKLKRLYLKLENVSISGANVAISERLYIYLERLDQ